MFSSEQTWAYPYQSATAARVFARKMKRPWLPKVKPEIAIADYSRERVPIKKNGAIVAKECEHYKATGTFKTPDTTLSRINSVRKAVGFKPISEIKKEMGAK